MSALRCVVCDGRIEWLEPPDAVGGWWVHEHHPADEHDARPDQAEITRLWDQARAHAAELVEIEDTLGPVLGYPIDSPDGPGGAHAVTGDHTPVTLAAAAVREIERLRGDLYAYQVRLADAQARIDAALALHRPMGRGEGSTYCNVCSRYCDDCDAEDLEPYPCATVRALRGESDG